MHNPKHSILPFTLALSWNSSTLVTTGILGISMNCPIDLERAMTDAFEFCFHPLLIPTILFAEVYSIYHQVLLGLAREISEIDLALRSRVNNENGDNIDYKSLLHAVNGIEDCIARLELQRTVTTFGNGIQNATQFIPWKLGDPGRAPAAKLLEKYYFEHVEPIWEAREAFLSLRVKFQKSVVRYCIHPKCEKH